MYEDANIHKRMHILDIFDKYPLYQKCPVFKLENRKGRPRLFTTNFDCRAVLIDHRALLAKYRALLIEDKLFLKL